MTGGSARYQIRVRGHLGQTMRTASPELRADIDGDDTVLSGALPDQASAYRRVDCDRLAVGVLVAGVARDREHRLGPLIQHRLR